MGKILHGFKEILSFIAVAMLLTILISNYIVMLYSVGYVYQFIGGEYFYIPIYLIMPMPLLFIALGLPVLLLLVYLGGIVAYAWYIFLAVSITAAFALFMYKGLKGYVNKLLKEPVSYHTTSIQEFSEIFAVVLFLAVVVTFAMRLAGVNTKGIGLSSVPLYAQMLSLLHASVYEELVTRLMFVGIPVYLIRRVFAKRKGEKPMSPIHILGGGYTIGKVEIVFILISAAIFGVAHTPAWGWWKFLPAFIAGVGMAYLYLKYGIHYSIMFHFATDFMYIGMSMSKMDMLFMSGVYVVLIILGAVFTVSYGIKIFQRAGLLKKGGSKTTKRRAPPPPTPWINVKCPNCGSETFVYLSDGKLKCVDCGTIFEPEYQEQSSQSSPEAPIQVPPPPP